MNKFDADESGGTRGENVKFPKQVSRNGTASRTEASSCTRVGNKGCVCSGMETVTVGKGTAVETNVVQQRHGNERDLNGKPDFVQWPSLWRYP